MSEPKRRLKKAVINFLSLCPRGVNRLPVMYKADDGNGTGTVDIDTLIKASAEFDDNGEITAVVYAPELLDSQNELASAEVIKEAMYDAAQRGLNIDVRHNNKALPKTEAFIAQSYIIKKGDPDFTDMKDYHGAPVDVTGGWAVQIKILNPELRKAYKDKAWNGISMGGFAASSVEKSDDIIARLVEYLSGKPLPTPRKDTEMTKEEMEANNAVLIAGIAKAVADAIKPPEVKPAPVVKSDEAPVFKGSLANAKEVRAHRFAVKRHELAKSLDWSNDESVAAYTEALEALNKEEGTDAPVKSETEIRLEKELKEARKRSNQIPANDKPVVTDETVAKADELKAMGKSIANYANKRWAKKQA